MALSEAEADELRERILCWRGMRLYLMEQESLARMALERATRGLAMIEASIAKAERQMAEEGL